MKPRASQPQHLLGWDNNPQFLWVGALSDLEMSPLLPLSLKLTTKIGGTLPTLLWKGSENSQQSDSWHLSSTDPWLSKLILWLGWLLQIPCFPWLAKYNINMYTLYSMGRLCVIKIPWLLEVEFLPKKTKEGAGRKNMEPKSPLKKHKTCNITNVAKVPNLQLHSSPCQWLPMPSP